MRIIALAAPPLPEGDEWHAVTRLVADRYEVRVLALDDLAVYGALFGEPVPDSLKPQAPWRASTGPVAPRLGVPALGFCECGDPFVTVDEGVRSCPQGHHQPTEREAT